jgi:hypothetical protein
MHQSQLCARVLRFNTLIDGVVTARASECAMQVMRLLPDTCRHAVMTQNDSFRILVAMAGDAD